jgi:membrane protein YqaA with SNARE-associated domain
MEYGSVGGLFLSAFISSTLAPGGSEAVLVYMATHLQEWQISSLIAIATLGNTLGALTTWGLGGMAAKKYSLDDHLSAKKQRAVQWVKKWGYWALLFSWLPIIGDGFCFAGGWLRLPLLVSTLVIGLGKGLRYWVIVQVATF